MKRHCINGQMCICLLVGMLSLFPVMSMAENASLNTLEALPVQIYFEQASSEFNPETNGNGKRLQSYYAKVTRILSANPSASCKFEVRSACSPEGRATTNWKLSDERANGVAEYLKQQFKLSESRIIIESVGADWDGFLNLIKEHASEIEHSDEAIEIFEKYPMSGRDIQAHNNRLQSFNDLRDRTVWDALAGKFFVQLRQTTVKAIFTLPSDNSSRQAITDEIQSALGVAKAVEPVVENVVEKSVETVSQICKDTVHKVVIDTIFETAPVAVPEPVSELAPEVVPVIVPETVSDNVVETPSDNVTVEAVISQPVAGSVAKDSMVLSSVGLQVYFHQSMYNLDVDYHDNGQRLKEFVETINAIIADPDRKFQRIEIRSSCSPEGSAGFNWQLSSDRANVVGDYLKVNYGISDDVIEIESVGTDWDGLYELILRDEATIDHAAEARAIIENNPMSSRRDAMTHSRRLELFNTLQGRRVWDNLHERYFPDLRTTTATVYFLESATKSQSASSIRPMAVESLAVSPSVESFARVEPMLINVAKPTREPMLSVKTNLLYDAFFYPGMGYQPILNIEVEYYFRHNKHWTILGEYEFPWWVKDSKYNYFQMLNWQLEGRRYFKADGTHTGHYLSAYGQYNLYDFCMHSSTGSGVQGEGGGFGLGYGYVMQLPWGKSDRWKLEFFLKAGYYVSRYDNYDAGTPYKGMYYYRWYNDPEDFIRRNNRFRWFGPTGVGVTISYDLIYRNVK